MVACLDSFTCEQLDVMPLKSRGLAGILLLP